MLLMKKVAFERNVSHHQCFWVMWIFTQNYYTIIKSCQRTGHNTTSSFIVVKTERSTSQQSVTQDNDYIASAYAATQDSNQWHDCHADSHSNCM